MKGAGTSNIKTFTQNLGVQPEEICGQNPHFLKIYGMKTLGRGKGEFCILGYGNPMLFAGQICFPIKLSTE